MSSKYDERFHLSRYYTFNRSLSVIYMPAGSSNLLEQGIIFFNGGRYFEAHEAWEDMWRPARGPLRLFYQGLVQSAVGMHHLTHGNLNGATAQLMKALAKLDQYPDRFCGIDNRKLTTDLRRVLAEQAPQPVQIRRLNE
jgi:predicted metal-dependent hydrolase